MTHDRRRCRPYESEDSKSRIHCATRTYPLYFFYDCETTGGGPFETRIIEIGATIANPHGRTEEKKTFSSFIRTSQPISPMGT